ncbi:hypothetical protein BDV18DRAFT_155690 [Aspergillus unguis]
MNRSQGPLGKLAQGVVTGIGFASEVRGYRKAKKAARQEQESELQRQIQHEDRSGSSSSPQSQSSHSESPEEERKADIDTEEPPPYEEIERSWELDEAQDIVIEAKGPRKSKSGVANPDKVIADFLQRHPPPYNGFSSGPESRLEYPVAIPQRRPKDKKRGFIRAYAPDLENVGVDQETWFDFIETLNEASLANPWINALNLASLAASPLPSAISMAVSTAIMVATTIAIETQGRYRQNKALDKLNDEFCRPRGLFCLVMTWDSTSFDSRTNADINTAIQNTIDSQGRISHKFQSSNGVTNGMGSIQTAQLIFPGLDLLATVTKDEKKSLKKKMQRGKLFVDDYMDRRAQAKFVSIPPPSPSQSKPSFNSSPRTQTAISTKPENQRSNPSTLIQPTNQEVGFKPGLVATSRGATCVEKEDLAADLLGSSAWPYRKLQTEANSKLQAEIAASPLLLMGLVLSFMRVTDTAVLDLVEVSD